MTRSITISHTITAYIIRRCKWALMSEHVMNLGRYVGYISAPCALLLYNGYLQGYYRADFERLVGRTAITRHNHLQSRGSDYMSYI